MEPELLYRRKPLPSFQSPRGNILFGAALTLAWQTLSREIIKQPIRVRSDDPVVQDIVARLNGALVSHKDLNQADFYATAGFGNQTVNRINKEVAAQFSSKSTQPIAVDLNPEDIIAFAYFVRSLKFRTPFQKTQIYFNNQPADGFCAKKPEHFSKLKALRCSSKDDLIEAAH